MSKLSGKEQGLEQAPPIKAVIGSLSTIIFGIFMVLLDSTAMNVMLPRLIADFGSSYSTVQWAITGYVLAQSAVIPLAGWVSDRFGAKRIFLISLSLFVIGSLLCAVASDIEQLVIFRIVQGLGGGMIVPIGMTFIYRLSPPGKVGAIMGFMAIPLLVAPAIGPAISGLMVDYVSWHWIFLINIPIGIVGVLLGIRKLPKIKGQSVAALDVIGMLLAPLAFVGLSYGINSAGEGWNSRSTIVGLSVGIVALVLFVIRQLKRSNPLLELRVFQSSSFTRGILVMWIAQIVLFGSLFLIPQLLQNVRDYSAFDAGLMMLPYALASAIVMQFSGRLFDKFGVRWLAIGGMSIMAIAGILLFRLSPDSGIGTMIVPLILLGSSMGLCMMPLNTHLLKAAPQHLVSRVTSLTGAMQQVMVSLSIASLSTIMTSRLKAGLSSGALSHTEAWSHAFHVTFLVLLSISVLGIFLACLIRKPQAGSAKITEVVMPIES